MAENPLITFKAGVCEFDDSVSPPKVRPVPTLGYIYLYVEDELLHFCWRPRSAPSTAPELELVMVPSDGEFLPYRKVPVSGRIYALKFTSSSTRHLFWLQSKAQDSEGRPDHWSARDEKLGKIVNDLLQGEDVNMDVEIADLRSTRHETESGDDDETMEDAPLEHHRSGTGGAGADATGGDVREEGEESREGGADGGRAPQSNRSQVASAAVQNFLAYLNRSNQEQQRQHEGTQPKPFATLPDLLTSAVTIPVVDNAPVAFIDTLLSYLPPTILVLAQESGETLSGTERTPEAAEAAIEALSEAQKKDILKRVLRSPQFNQSLESLTMALRDGGLPNISQALGVEVENGGYVRGGTVPLGGGDAVASFLEGIKRSVEGGHDDEEEMKDTD